MTTEFLNLTATLLSSSPARPETLLQLHALLGSMLSAALQLVDRREVVRVLLPGGRVIHQVTSSAGAPYTLFLDLPPAPTVEADAHVKVEVETAVDESGKDRGSSGGGEQVGEEGIHRDGGEPTTPTKNKTAADGNLSSGSASVTSVPPSPIEDDPFPVLVADPEPAPAAVEHAADMVSDKDDDTTRSSKDEDEDRRTAYRRALAETMARMYCPCPGFAYNSLTGERNVFCKHILAVLLAHHLGRMLETEIGLAAVADLVGASPAAG